MRFNHAFNLFFGACIATNVTNHHKSKLINLSNQSQIDFKEQEGKSKMKAFGVTNTIMQHGGKSMFLKNG